MAGIVKGSTDLTKVPKDRIIVGKKGKYINVAITVNDEEDQFGNFGPIIVDQTKGVMGHSHHLHLLRVVHQKYNLKHNQPWQKMKIYHFN